ncbi:MAG: hypothetical protein IKS70_01625, partial [Bacteroides sp.]|nr:hypothetical protein [Bacteroides sp.]
VHEEPNGRMERMASQTIQAVHLETVEEAKNQASESAETWHPGKIRLDDSNVQKRILVHGRNHSSDESHIK